MTEYTINLTTAEDLALSYVAAEQHNWIDNVVRDRCRIATEEIVKICVDSCLASNIQIPANKDEIVVLAFDQGWVKSASDRNNEIEVNKPIEE